MPLEADRGAREGDVVIGREQGDQAVDEAADGFGEANGVEAEAPEAWDGDDSGGVDGHGSAGQMGRNGGHSDRDTTG